jgi:hypothetical protein
VASPSSDARPYAANLRVELLATDSQDARATLDEIATRLFGEEHVVTIVVPESSAIHPINETGVQS